MTPLATIILYCSISGMLLSVPQREDLVEVFVWFAHQKGCEIVFLPNWWQTDRKKGCECLVDELLRHNIELWFNHDIIDRFNNYFV